MDASGLVVTASRTALVTDSDAQVLLRPVLRSLEVDHLVLHVGVDSAGMDGRHPHAIGSLLVAQYP